MELDLETQGPPATTDPAVAPTGEQGQPVPDPAVVQDLTSRYGTIPDTAPATPEGQGTQQGMTQPGPQLADGHFQSLYGQERAQRLALEQELTRLKQPAFQPQQFGQWTNPHNPQTEPDKWWRAENQHDRELLVQQTRQEFMSMLQSATQQSQESQWAAQHPGVDVNAVKAFAQANGITQLDHAFLVMTYPSQLANARTQGAQQGLQQFQHPQPGASPVRGAQGSPASVALDYDKMGRELLDNPQAENDWPKEVREAFWAETHRRSRPANW